jgi:hypothetical protein
LDLAAATFCVKPEMLQVQKYRRLLFFASGNVTDSRHLLLHSGLTPAVCSGFQTSIQRNNWIHSSRCPGHSCHVDLNHLVSICTFTRIISPIICKNYL